MRNVQRVATPRCLTRNATRWEKEYLEALELKDSALKRRRRTRYNHSEVRDTLSQMYRQLCCYCEGEIGAVGADQIEHRKPIELFPELGFNWDNLHLACAGCNRAKSDKWNDECPILDAVNDSPIAEHLGYQSSETGIRCTWRTACGNTTATDADLNRETLRQERMKVFGGVLGVIGEIRTRLKVDPDDIEAMNRRAELQEKCEGRYGTMIQWAIEEWLDPYV